MQLELYLKVLETLTMLQLVQVTRPVWRGRTQFTLNRWRHSWHSQIHQKTKELTKLSLKVAVESIRVWMQLRWKKSSFRISIKNMLSSNLSERKEEIQSLWQSMSRETMLLIESLRRHATLVTHWCLPMSITVILVTNVLPIWTTTAPGSTTALASTIRSCSSSSISMGS